MGSNIARRLIAVVNQIQAHSGRTILAVVEPDDTEAEANARVELHYGPIISADTVTRIITNVKCGQRAGL